MVDFEVATRRCVSVVAEIRGETMLVVGPKSRALYAKDNSRPKRRGSISLRER